MVSRVLVGAILIRDTAVLLGKRAPTRTFYPNLWDVFGGHVEQHESPKQALVRELQEELAITPLAIAEVAIVDVEPDAVEDAPSEPPYRYEYHRYHMTRWEGAPQNRLLEEHSEIRWVPLDEVRSLDLASPEYLPIFRWLAATDIAPS